MTVTGVAQKNIACAISHIFSCDIIVKLVILRSNKLTPKVPKSVAIKCILITLMIKLNIFFIINFNKQLLKKPDLKPYQGKRNIKYFNINIMSEISVRYI